MEESEYGLVSADTADQPSAFAPLRERDYRRYFIGNVLSNLGTFCQTIAQSLLVYQLTGSTFLVGVVNSCSTSPSSSSRHGPERQPTASTASASWCSASSPPG